MAVDKNGDKFVSISFDIYFVSNSVYKVYNIWT